MIVGLQVVRIRAGIKSRELPKPRRDDLAQQQVMAPSKEQVVDSLGGAASKLRRGERILLHDDSS